MILYAIGDNLTSGAEILNDRDMEESNKAYAYPMYIANKLKYDECDNKAIAYAPNEWIARRGLLDIQGLLDKGYKAEDLRVIVGWASINRSEISIKELTRRNPGLDKEFQTAHTSTEQFMFDTMFIDIDRTTDGDGELALKYGDMARDFFLDYTWEHGLEYEKWYSQILFLQNYLENNNIKYLFHNTGHACDVKAKFLENNIRYYKPEDSFKQWAKDYETRALGGLVEEAHGDYADLLLEYINKHELF